MVNRRSSLKTEVVVKREVFDGDRFWSGGRKRRGRLFFPPPAKKRREEWVFFSVLGRRLAGSLADASRKNGAKKLWGVSCITLISNRVLRLFDMRESAL